MTITQLRIPSIVKGLGTRVPFVDRLANGAAGSRVGASYFYAVWMRHLRAVSRRAPGFAFDVVGELGPGDALGLGLCALLSGARRYVGLDRLPFALRADNLALLSELKALFDARAPIPDGREFGHVYPLLDDYAFPHDILDDQRLDAALAPPRIDALAREIRGGLAARPDGMLTYAAPWDAATNTEPGTVDLLLSQAVMEHVDDVDMAYAAMRRWMKPSGLMSHRIDYSCHGITHDWYGHWLVSEPMWRLARGKRAYFINRLTHPRQITSMQQAGFEVIAVTPTLACDAAPEPSMRVAHRPDDLQVRGATVIARPLIT